MKKLAFILYVILTAVQSYYAYDIVVRQQKHEELFLQTAEALHEFYFRLSIIEKSLMGEP